MQRFFFKKSQIFEFWKNVEEIKKLVSLSLLTRLMERLLQMESMQKGELKVCFGRQEKYGASEVNRKLLLKQLSLQRNLHMGENSLHQKSARRSKLQ